MGEELQLLIKQCIAGQKSAQSHLYALYAPTLFGICLRYAKNREDAEEILQEGFIKIFENVDKFRNEGSFEGWLKKITVNCALQKNRANNNLTIVTQFENNNLNIADREIITSNLEAKELLKIIQNLSSNYRLVFNLYVFEGMKHKEIADLLGISEGTSKSNLHDARAILQKAINKTEIISKINIC